jgi:hypothetical protein
MGALLAPGKRTVSACLRMTGRAEASNFTVYHQVLNRGRWKGRALARTLLDLVIAALVPEGPVIIGVDDTIERRWGPRIAARGIYRDPVRSSHGHFVKTSGLRWLSFMVLAPVPWAARVKALPVLTLLAPSERATRKPAAGTSSSPTGRARACCSSAAGCPAAGSSSSATRASPSIRLLTLWPGSRRGARR